MVISIGHVLATREMQREPTYFNVQTQITNMYFVLVKLYLVFSFSYSSFLLHMPLDPLNLTPSEFTGCAFGASYNLVEKPELVV